MNATRELLRQLARHDDLRLRAVLAEGEPSALSREIRALVELAALLAADATTTSLRWAVDRAAAAGAGDETVVWVLLVSAAATGSAQTVSSAARLALALDVDPGWQPREALTQ